MGMGPSRVEAKRAAGGTVQISTTAPTYACMAGITEMGPIGSCNGVAGGVDENLPLTSWEAFKAIYGDYTTNARDLPAAAQGFFDEGGQLLYVSRVVHCTSSGDASSKTSAAAQLILYTDTQTASSAYVQGVATSGATYVLVPSQQLDVLVDALTVVNAVFNATAAQRDSAAGPYALTNGMTLTISCTSVFGTLVLPTLTFTTSMFSAIGAATAAEVAAVLNGHFSANNAGLTALVAAGAVRIKTTMQGLGASLNITGGTANAVLSYTTGAVAGGGNVQRIDAVTIAELKTIVEAATSSTCTVSTVSGKPQITSNTTGSGSHVQVQSSSTATAFGFDNVVHTGGAAGTAQTLQFDARWDGTYANALSVRVQAAASGDATRRDVQVLKNGTVVESWSDLSLNRADMSYAVDVINKGANSQRASTLVKVTDLLAAYPSPGNLPAVGTFGPLTGGSDGLAGLTDTDFVGAAGNGTATGLHVFDTITRIDLAGLPGRNTAGAQAGLVTWCEITREGRTFAVMGSAAALTANAVRSYVVNTAGLKELTEIGVFAWPRIFVDNPKQSVFGSADTITIDPVGQLMGVYALVDRSKVGGAFSHPSNALGKLRTGRGVESKEVENPVLRGLVQNDRIITLRSKGGQVYIDGARTLRAAGNFPSVGESRGVMLVCNQIVEAYEDSRNANITTGLYSSLTSAAEVYLSALTDAGCFRSKKYDEAYFVSFSKQLNTTAVVDAAEVLGVIGLNTSPPAEIISVSVVPYRGLAQAFANAA